MYTLKYTTESPETMALLQKFCPEEGENISLKKSKRPSLSFRRAVVLALVRRLLIEEFHITLDQVSRVLIHREASGAPYLILPETSSLPSNFHISISHTGPWVAFILSDLKNPTTIDIEDSQKQRAFTEIASSIFSEQEQNYVERYGALGFYYLWGAKESLAKWYKQDLPFALGIDLKDQLPSPSQNSRCFIEYNHQKFLLTFLVNDTVLITTCKEQGK
ncbi:MAG TPA: hypothetical protein DD412_05140 [Holosporales bacterium]|nr:hypothetical protein [Holosporales bacterium]